MRILGIDYGEKRVGVAIGDTSAPVAVPKTIIQMSRKLVLDIGKIVKEENIEKIIIGLPLTMDGEEGEMSRRVRIFGNEIESKTGISVDYIDERLSSVQVTRDPAKRDDARPSRRPSSKLSNIDAAAASVVLQTWFDRYWHES